LPPGEGCLELTFLGTGAAAPTLARNVSGLALRLTERGEIWLFDCGEGTQHQFMRSGLRLSRVRRIFISHLHGDHVYGLPGLLASRSQVVADRPIDLYGPPGLRAFVASWLPTGYSEVEGGVTVHQPRPGLVCVDGELSVHCRPLRHRVPTLGYRVDERSRPGAFDAERAAALGVPAGPLYGRLKRGERLVLEDGRAIDGRALVGPSEPGRALAYCCDTAYCDEAVELARGVDLLIHEATFAEGDAEVARVGRHSTAAVAARVAREAGAKALVLTHISSRYAAGAATSEAELLDEARVIFPGALLAHDLLRLRLPRHSQVVGTATGPD
jgi:ribonuclease Z